MLVAPRRKVVPMKNELFSAFEAIESFHNETYDVEEDIETWSESDFSESHDDELFRVKSQNGVITKKSGLSSEGSIKVCKNLENYNNTN